MNKFISAVLSIVLVVGLSACSKAIEEIKYEVQLDDQTIVYNIKHQGDKIKEVKLIHTIPYAEHGITKEEVEEQIAEEAKDTDNGPGLVVVNKVDDKAVVETTEIDVEKVGMKKLQEMGLVSPGKVDYLSLKITIEDIEKQGGKKIE